MCTPIIDLGCSPINEWGLDQLIGGATEEVAGSAWDKVCMSFAESSVQMLQSFADSFVRMPNVDLASDGIQSVYGVSLGLGAVVAAMIMLIQTARTAFSHDGSALAQAFVGLGKVALAFMTTLTIAGAGLVASDEITAWIVERSFGDADGLKEKLASLMDWKPEVSLTLVMVLAVVAIVLVIVLWFEMILRNAALAVLIATSPIAAAGQLSESTSSWWSKLVSASIQLIILKPVIALVFAVGFGVTSGAEEGDVATFLAGMLILLLAGLAWPAIARFMTFTQASMSGSTGGAGMLGFAAGSASGRGGGTVGVNPAQFSQAAEARTMASSSAGSSSAGASASGGSGAGGGAWIAAAAAALQAGQKGTNALMRRMEQTAGHAGMDGANPYTMPAGTPSGGRMGTNPVVPDVSGHPRPSAAAPVVPPDNGSPPTPPPST